MDSPQIEVITHSYKVNTVEIMIMDHSRSLPFDAKTEYEVSASSIAPGGKALEVPFQVHYLNVKILSSDNLESVVEIAHPKGNLTLTIPSAVLTYPSLRRQEKTELLMGLGWFFLGGAGLAEVALTKNGWNILIAFVIWYVGFAVLQIGYLQYQYYRKTGKFEKMSFSFNPSILIAGKRHSLRR